MNKHTSIHAILGAALLITTLGACADDGDEPTASGATTTATATDPTGSTGTPTTTDGTTTVDPTTTTTDPTTTDPTTDPTTGGGDPFVFPTDPIDSYTQIDRHAAVEAGTAGIAAAAGLGLEGQDITIRDAYNASNPTEDAAMKWIGEIAASVMFFHGALDDDLIALKLVPATFEETVAQAGPVIIPDTIKYNPSMPTSYPNGRKLEDPVVDITLAAVLLKLGDGGVPLDFLANLPLNPTANDVPFKGEFPYLAPPHAP
jgi:hypothetical protein